MSQRGANDAPGTVKDGATYRKRHQTLEVGALDQRGDAAAGMDAVERDVRS